MRYGAAILLLAFGLGCATAPRPPVYCADLRGAGETVLADRARAQVYSLEDLIQQRRLPSGARGIKA